MAKLYWTGDVGWYNEAQKEGITTQMVLQALKELGGAKLEVELTTFGGDYFMAAPIMNALRDYTGEKIVYLNGIVASAGTVIAMGFDKVIARPTSMFMIHNAQGMSYGDHNAMRNDADRQEKMSHLVRDVYAKKTGKSIEKIEEWMNGKGDGTWFMGQEILDAGFADEMENADEKPTSMMLLCAQRDFQAKVTMWVKKPVSMDTSTMSSIESLIDSGAIDKTSPIPAANETALCIDKNPVAINGKVYLSSLRSISARAEKDNPELAQWATAMVSKIRAKGDLKVNKEAVLAWLKDNPGCASEVAATMGLNLVTESVTKAVEMKAKLDAEKIADPLALIATMKADLEKVETARIEAAMSVFGPKVSPSGAKNKSREFAELALRGVKSDEIEAKIEEVKKNEVFLALRGELFDVNSDWNLIGVSEGLNKDVTLESGKRGIDMKASALVL